MKEVLIDKQIGGGIWSTGITAESVQAALDEAGNEEIKIVIDSPGGNVFECVSIYNTIREFCRKKKNKVTTYIRGLAASAASVIALAANEVDKSNKIIVEDNSVYMIHNCWDWVIGNKNDLRVEADFLERIDEMVQNAAYRKRTGKSAAKIREMMDAETWLFGREIVEQGFADEVVEADDTTDGIGAGDPLGAVAFAKERFKNMRQGAAKIDFATFKEKAAACVVPEFKCGSIENKPAGEPEKNPKTGEKMTLDEFRTSNPAAFAAFAEEREAEGVRKEKVRVERLLKMGEVAKNTALAIDFIKAGKDPSDDDVQDKFFEARAASEILAQREEDESGTPEVHLSKDKQDAREAAIMAAFEKEFE